MNANFPRSTKIEKPAKNHRCPCDRCGGSGIFYIHGTCFRCGGSGVDPTYRTWAYPAAWTDEQCQASVEKREAQSVARREKAAAKRKAEEDSIYAGNLARCPALSRFDDNDYAVQFDGFVHDLLSKSHRYALSDRQLACITKAVESKDAYLARKAGWDAKRAEERANAKPCPAGRVEVHGAIVSIKEYTGDYGIAIKCLLQCDGYKLFGTVPASLVADAKAGDVIRLTATVKEKEPGFGTYSRPTGGEILTPAIA